MGKLNIFEITLANSYGVFFAGQVVQGHVTVELTESMNMREIRLKFRGQGYVHWTEQHTTGSGDHRRTETRHYRAEENYFDTSLPLFGRGLGQGESNTLGSGRHTFPFQFTLPPSLPSSFEGEHGHVRFWIKATIDKPWKFDHTTKRAFTVICLLDLNREPTAAMAVQGQNEKTLCCLCCASGPITAVFRMDRKGYVPGEAILINAEIDNKSNREMDSSKVKLKMHTIFHARGKSRSTTRNVAMLSHGEIDEGKSDTWSGEKLVIPPLPPSYLVGCGIIDIRYILQLDVDPKGPGFDLEVPLEVIIGTIPLVSVVQQYQAAHGPIMTQPAAQGFAPPPGFAPPAGPVVSYDKSAEAIGTQPPMMPTAPPGDIPNMPPPSYAECAFGKVNIKDDDDNEHTKGDMQYAPMYTYYNWN